MTVWILRADHKEACLEQLNSHWNAYRDNPSKSADYAIVINGSTLKFAVELYPAEFLRLAAVCHSVVCCRVTPLQKAEVVRLVKERQQAICLAIGDGANDVAMIQAAQIGVGIYGKEGSQAARSADYAIRLFKHLRRLVSVHGRYSLLRNALLVQYSFYKGAAGKKGQKNNNALPLTPCALL
jgi:phospholipid-transporting ATPase